MVRTLVVLFCVWLTGFSAVYGGEPGRVLRYSVREGLSAGIVNSIVQDRDGYIWIATGDGLNRFDGNRFTVFRNDPGNPHSLAGNYVRALHRDKNGTLWASTRAGICEFIPGTGQFNRYQPFPGKDDSSNDISDIVSGRNGNLWVSLNSSGFASFDLASHRFTCYQKPQIPDLHTNSLLTLLEDSQGLLWLGSRDSGIQVLKRGSDGKLKDAGISVSGVPATRVNAFCEDRRHNVWIATSKGLYLFDRKKGTFRDVPLRTFWNSGIYLSVLEDRDGQIFVGVQDGGVYRLREVPASGTPVFERVENRDNQGITQRSVQALFQDKDKNLWFGTYGEGAYLVSSIPEKFRKFEKKVTDARGESFLRFYGLVADREGNLWVGSDGDGIYKTAPSGELLRHYRPAAGPGNLTDGAVITAYRDREDRLWFGTYSGGLFRYDAASDRFRRYAHDPANPQSLGRNDIRAVCQDSQKRLWVGTNGGGLSLLDVTTGQARNFIPSNSSLNSNDVRCFAEDARGNLWIGTYGGGLNYLDTRTMQFTSFFNTPGKSPFLSNRIVFSLYLDEKQRLWIGTEGNGLLVYDTHRQTTRLFDERSGLANNVINAIRPERDGVAWISTNKGLSRVDLNRGSVENYDASHGLQAGAFNPGSALVHPSGFLVFGGTEGWNLFYPAQVRASAFEPDVRITGVRVFGRRADGDSLTEELSPGVLATGELTLAPDQPVFSIGFTALNYAYPERARFAYRLDGLDKEWNYVQDEHAVTYRYLPPGTYTFQVRAANQDGIWFDRYASLTIHVTPPWYRTTWAYFLYAATLALGVYFWQRYRLGQQQMKFEVQLAHLEKRRQMEANERKISFFTNVSHEFRTPLTLIINPARELLRTLPPDAPGAPGAQIIYRNAKRLLSLVDQLLLFRKAEQQTFPLHLSVHPLPKLAEEVFQYFLHQAESRHIRYEFICEAEELPVTCDWEKMEIALFNLLSNALKFTPDGGFVRLEVRDQGDQVCITVSDSGPGIPPEAGDSVFKVFQQHAGTRTAGKGGFGIGLFLAKTFVEQHFGRIWYESVPDAGTTFHVLLWKEHAQLLPETGPGEVRSSVLLDELSEGVLEGPAVPVAATTVAWPLPDEAEIPTLLIIDDDEEIRGYLRGIFTGTYKLLEAASGETGLDLVRQHQPDVVVSDVRMSGLSGIELCRAIKLDMALSHIPVILLTASTSHDTRLEGIEGGADDFIMKPFDRDILVARVAAVLRKRNDLQRYFYHAITLQAGDFRVSQEYKEFLDHCIRIVEAHLTDPEFGVKVLATEIGMSQSTLHNRIKSVSGQSANRFIRFIRLRKAAQLLITTDLTIAEAAYRVGMNDIKHFREHFSKLFGQKPSEYIRQYRKPFHENLTIDREVFRGK
jgi:signal transduction histidine kinase/ligand-binding sensor domain-containing protein/DNA-binding response OmpR family regulator